MAKLITIQRWEAFLRARQMTGFSQRQTLGKGFLVVFKDELSTTHQDRIKYLDRTGTAFDVREYIEKELVEK